jgi:hypothetical protein
MPGDGHLEAGVAGDQAVVELGDLPLVQVLPAVAEQPTDLVQRVVLEPAVTELFLLHPAADFVDDLGAQLHDVEGVQDRDGVGQLVADRVGVAPERVERGVFDPRR